ncbi:cobalamin B12-binding domain-containing protein, partial [Pelagibacterales bacterium SAG-MED16]|nr:cobalamin B12-binding domain-containing protein [Pelagibacterales bacterium SAG-MED16]
MSLEKNLDCLFLVSNSSSKTYQSLSKTYSAVEPPTWALLLAQSTRSIGFKVKILDANAENLTEKEILDKVKNFLPKMICLIVYGQNVNAGTTNMSGAINISEYLKKNIDIPISIIGSHVQALPIDTLKKEKSIDFVFTNEGVYALRNILKINDFSSKNLSKIKGIAYRDKDKIIMNEPESIVPNEKMDIDLPGYAWDLLPYKKKPLDLYRAPMWHAEYDFEKRTPYASLQTSLGCQFGCNFCMINILNRND